MRWLTWLACSLALPAQTISVPGLKSRVEILRDRWGVPHIYATNAHDLFLAQGWVAAKDRLFQIDLWRRQGTGRLAEVLGPKYLVSDRIARLVRYRGDWNEEWRSYSPDARAIAMAFTAGINAYIDSLGGKRTKEFAVAGYDPGRWRPEDVTARIAGLAMLRNASSEIARALDIQRFGLDRVREVLTTDPPVRIEIPKGLEIDEIRPEMIRDLAAATRAVRLGDGELDGSNNWVVDGTLSATGKPLLASDPHRTLSIPSLRKTVHLVAPGWNVIGAGEPALPGVALGHNEEIGFGFTIVGIDQQDLYLERLNPQNLNQYRYRDQWVDCEIEREEIPVKGAPPAIVELKYTRHGPVIYEDHTRRLAVALRWAGSEPGGAGYLPALALARAKNWTEFRRAAAHYKTPSENLVYADRAGNIGWIAAGLTPVRQGWSGLLPVPGDTGEFEWQGWLSIDQMPQRYNPREHWIATANANHLPPGYPHVLGFEFSPAYRYQRLAQLLGGAQRFTVADFVRMQQDITALSAKQFQNILRRWRPTTEAGKNFQRRLLAWSGEMAVDSVEATVFEAWLSALGPALFGEIGGRVSRPRLLAELDRSADLSVLGKALGDALDRLKRTWGPESAKWQWGHVHQIAFRHPIDHPDFHLPPRPRGGSADTVMASGWDPTRPFATNHGASFKMVLDTADWDRSVMTNAPGESGDPDSPHYRDLVDDWLAGRPHPLPFTRAAVEAVTVERLTLVPHS